MILCWVLLGLVFAETERGLGLRFIDEYYSRVPYMDVQYTRDGRPKTGRIRFKLFWRATPYTALNFAILLTKNNPLIKAPSYEDSIFHRIIPGFMMQGGDITRMDGTGGTSIYGPRFRDESFRHRHRAGVLSMANRGPHTNSSQFFITFRPQPHLDGRHVVFGRVLDRQSWRVVKDIESVRTESTVPRPAVRVVGCGFADRADERILRG